MKELTKVCSNCNKELPVNSIYFNKDNKCKHGFKSICKKCNSEKISSVIKNNTYKLKDEVFITCKDCNKNYPASDKYFTKDYRGKYGFRNRCKACYSKYTKLLREKNKKVNSKPTPIKSNSILNNQENLICKNTINIKHLNQKYKIINIYGIEIVEISFKGEKYYPITRIYKSILNRKNNKCTSLDKFNIHKFEVVYDDDNIITTNFIKKQEVISFLNSIKQNTLDSIAIKNLNLLNKKLLLGLNIVYSYDLNDVTIENTTDYDKECISQSIKQCSKLKKCPKCNNFLPYHENIFNKHHQGKCRKCANVDYKNNLNLPILIYESIKSINNDSDMLIYCIKNKIFNDMIENNISFKSKDIVLNYVNSRTMTKNDFFYVLENWLGKSSITDCEVRKFIKDCNLETIFRKLFDNKNINFYSSYMDFKNTFYPIHYLKDSLNDWHDDDDIRIKTFKYFIENDLNITSTYRIPFELTSSMILKYNKLGLCFKKYYNYNIYELANDCYPGIFKQTDFNNNKTLNFDSTEEYQLDKILREYFKNVVYNMRNTQNTINICGKIPDWVIINENKPIIVEYFGLWNEKSNSELCSNYVKRTKVKMEEYESLTSYDKIYLFPEDLKYKFKGVHLKLINYNKFNSSVKQCC